MIRIKKLYVDGYYRLTDIAEFMCVSKDKVAQVLASAATNFGPVDYQNSEKYPQYKSSSNYGKALRKSLHFKKA